MTFMQFGEKSLSGVSDNLKGKGFRATLCKVAWWATVYCISMQRNKRLYGGNLFTDEQIIKRIKWGFRAKINSP